MFTNLLCPKNWRKLASDDAQGVDGVDPHVRDPRVSVCDHILTISKGVLIWHHCRTICRSLMTSYSEGKQIMLRRTNTIKFWFKEGQKGGFKKFVTSFVDDFQAHLFGYGFKKLTMNIQYLRLVDFRSQPQTDCFRSVHFGQKTVLWSLKKFLN